MLFMIWCFVGLCSLLFFRFNSNAVLKRRLWPVFMAATCLVFCGFFYLILSYQQPKLLYLLVSTQILTSVLSTRMTCFCDFCGKTFYRELFSANEAACPQCRAGLG